MVSYLYSNWKCVESVVHDPKLNLHREFRSVVASCTCFCFSLWNTVNGKHLMDSQFSTSKKPSTIQNGRTFFKPLTHVSMWCDVNGWLSDVEKANALVPIQKHLLIYSFGWNYIVDWSLFLVFERDKQNICYHTHVNRILSIFAQS